jgi:hypothetical protein
MSDFHYPVINEKDITLIARLYEANPTYFDTPECPYSQDIKDIYKGTAKYHDFDTHIDNSEIPSSDTLISQINELMTQLKSFGKNIEDSEEASAQDRSTYFRLSATLIEKLLDMREKVCNIKDYELFVNEILDIMDRICTADQRQEIMDRLQKFVPEKELVTTTTEEETKGAKNEQSTNVPGEVATL